MLRQSDGQTLITCAGNLKSSIVGTEFLIPEAVKGLHKPLEDGIAGIVLQQHAHAWEAGRQQS